MDRDKNRDKWTETERQKQRHIDRYIQRQIRREIHAERHREHRDTHIYIERKRHKNHVILQINYYSPFLELSKEHMLRDPETNEVSFITKPTSPIFMKDAGKDFLSHSSGFSCIFQ